MKFTESLPLNNSSDEIWKRVSDIERIPQFWHGTKSVRVAERKTSSAIDISVTYAFGGNGKAEVSIDHEKRVVTISYYSGPFTGMQTIAVDSDTITASWDVKFTGLFKLISRWNEQHFRSGTIHALERLRAGSANANAT